MFRTLKDWLFGKRSSRTNRRSAYPHARARLGLEMLEARDLPSATVPGFTLTNGNLYNTAISQTQPIDTGVKSFAVVNSEVVDLHTTNGLLETMNGDGTGKVTVNTGITSFKLDGAGDVIYLYLPAGSTTGGNLYQYNPTTGFNGDILWLHATASYGIDGAGGTVALDDQGNLYRYAPNSYYAQTVNTGITSFKLDGAGDVIYLYLPAGSSTGGNLYQYNPTTGFNGDILWLHATASYGIDGAGGTVALDDQGNLYRYAPNSYYAQTVNTNITSFKLDGAGDVIYLYLPAGSSTGGNLYQYNPTTGFNGDILWLHATASYGIDGAGGTVALDDQGNLYRYAPNSYYAQTVNTGITSFKFDGAGDVIYLYLPAGSSTGNLYQYNPTTGVNVPINDAPVSSLVVDGAGSVVALEQGTTAGSVVGLQQGGHLVRFAPGGNSPLLISGWTSVTSFALDISGSVVALFQDGSLRRFAPGADGASNPINNSSVVSFAIAGDGALFALGASGILQQLGADGQLHQVSFDLSLFTALVSSPDGTVYSESSGGWLYKYTPLVGWSLISANPYVRDASTGAVDLIQNGERCWLSPVAYAYLQSPAYTNISDATFGAIPAGPNYNIPNGAFLRDASTGAIDIVENGQGCWLSPAVYAFLGSPAYINISDAAFGTLPSGPQYFPAAMIAAAENHPIAAKGLLAYSAFPETLANFSNPYGVLFGIKPYNALSGTTQQPSFLAVEQGGLGDCWLLASLAEVAARAPSDITSMFTFDGTAMENGSLVGIYSVRFFNSNGVAEYVTVDTELPAGGGYYDHPINNVLWVALAEKAYAEANGAGFVTSFNVGNASYEALNGGWPSWALQAITGKSASDNNPINVAAAWNAGQLIVLTTTNPASAYIVGDHCYAVVGYNLSSTPYELFNPWGGTTSSEWCPQANNVYGLFDASPVFLSQNFTGQSVGTEATAGHSNRSQQVADLWSTSDPDELMTANHTFKASDAGKHSFRVTFKTAGTQSLDVNDTLNSLLAAQDLGIKVV